MIRAYTFIAFLLIAFSARSQSLYQTATIPKELLAHALAVVRNSEEVIEIQDKEHVIFHEKLIVTVLNKNGAHAAELVLPHNKMYIIKNIQGAIFDEFGKQTDKIAERNFEDAGYTDGYTLFEDIRYKHYEPPGLIYPYTVEFDYDVRSNETLHIEQWQPIEHEGVAVENSSCKVICKPDYKINYREKNYPGTVAISSENGKSTYLWQVHHLPALRDEPFSPDFSSYTPNVTITSKEFNYGGLDGSYTSWQELGKWIYDKLLAGRTLLPSETVQQVKDLTKDISDPKERARKVYEYMQNKTRYVSIQVGIGGYQPFAATDVDRLGYGDCKGLVNYTQALLKAAGVESYYCPVTAGSFKESFFTDFPNMQGNHIILCLPFKNDTTWLECTSQKIPFGYLGDFTDDRWVLACTPEGGKLMHTPKYSADDNQENQQGEFTISGDGELSGDMTTKFTGTQFENRYYLLDESPDERQKRIRKIYPINNMDIEKLDLSPDKSVRPSITEHLKLKAPEYASVESGKIYFMINSVNRASNIRDIKNRVAPLYINRGYTDNDKIVYTLPQGYHVERANLKVELKKPFGNFYVSIMQVKNQLIYTRSIKIIDGTYRKEDYADLVDFYQEVADADNYTVVLAKDK